MDIASVRYEERLLGREGIDYIQELLSHSRNRGLASLLFECIEFAAGRAISFVPAAATQAKALEFNGGPGLSTGTTTSHLRKKIQTYLESHDIGVAIFDEIYTASAEVQGSLLKGMDPRVAMKFYRDEVYLCCSEPDLAVVEEAHEMSSGFLSYGILTTVSDVTNWATTSEVSLAVLDDAARNVEHVFVEAYDEEGYVIWSK